MTHVKSSLSPPFKRQQEPLLLRLHRPGYDDVNLSILSILSTTPATATATKNNQPKRYDPTVKLSTHKIDLT